MALSFGDRIQAVADTPHIVRKALTRGKEPMIRASYSSKREEEERRRTPMTYHTRRAPMF